MIIVLLFLHFAYHLIASVSVVYSLLHSNGVHKKAVWKLIAAFIWFVISCGLVYNEVLIHSACH